MRIFRFAFLLKLLLPVAVLAVGILIRPWVWPWIHFSRPISTQPIARNTPSQLERTCTEYAQREELQFDAYVAVRNDRLVASCGDVDLPINTHSARKSILSALIGIAIEKRYLRLDQSLDELGVDESKAPLTPTERSATLRDLLMSRSGVYIEASGETNDMKTARPLRGSQKPGEHFYYNNWDFNVLGEIFERATGKSVGVALHEWIAVPIGMETFQPDHVIKVNNSASEHAQFVIFMSAADMARFGMLYLHEGMWHGKQVIPRAWISESLAPLTALVDSSMQPVDHFGYSWWLDTHEGTAWAMGWGGQYMTIDRARQLVVVTRQDTGRSQFQLWRFIRSGEFRPILRHELVRRWTISSSESTDGVPAS